MTFTVGETVVYPNHGAAVIEDIEMRSIKGEERQYLVLRIVAQQDLVVRVPACNLDLVGVRDVVDKEGLDRVFDVLRAIVPDEPTNWSRRYKANLEKLHSGDVMKVAEVVRDDIAHDIGIHLRVPVDEDVAESHHGLQAVSEVRRNPPVPHEDLDEVPARRRLAQPIVGDDMGGDIESRLDGHL